ncbi:MAG TPA: HAD hydrolase-like protein [Patescibacteria group bacterium]|nr:HAD hydrolase-like protein [Patescibacteria group bacterium]
MATFIFDFDGTIADSFGLGVDISQEILKRDNKLAKSEVAKLRGLSARQVIKQMGIRWWQLPPLMTQGRKAMNARLGEVLPFEQLVSVLRQLHQDGHQLMVLSSNSHINVGQFLETNNLRDCFDHIYGNASLFNKAAKLRKIVRENHLHTNQCWYVGDEVRDIAAAHSAKMPCIAVGWGFNNAKALQAAKPAVFIKEPKQLLTIANRT